MHIYSHFIDKDLSSEKLSNLPKFTQLVNKYLDLNPYQPQTHAVSTVANFLSFFP